MSSVGGIGSLYPISENGLLLLNYWEQWDPNCTKFEDKSKKELSEEFQFWKNGISERIEGMVQME